jgi:hypothetical protein
VVAVVRVEVRVEDADREDKVGVWVEVQEPDKAQAVSAYARSAGQRLLTNGEHLASSIPVPSAAPRWYAREIFC